MNKYKLTYKDIIISIISVIIVILADLLQTLLISKGIMEPDMHIYFKFRIMILAIVATLFGPVVGFTVGFSGTLLICLYTYNGISFIEIFADAIFCTILGLYAEKFEILKGKFSGVLLVDFNMLLLMANLFCSIILPPLPIFLTSGGNLLTIVLTGIKAAFTNCLASGIVCTPILVAITKIMKKRARYVI